MYSVFFFLFSSFCLFLFVTFCSFNFPSFFPSRSFLLTQSSVALRMGQRQYHTQDTRCTRFYTAEAHTRRQKRQKATNTHNETTSKANVVMTTITTRTEICKSLERPSFLFDEISFLFPLAQFLLQHSKPSRYLFLMNLNPFRYPLFCFFSIASCFYVLLTSFVIASCFSFCL